MGVERAVQEEELIVRCSEETRTVRYTVDSSHDDDRGQGDIDNALDNQALDLCYHHELSMDEAS